jgi:hypothetical protein
MSLAQPLPPAAEDYAAEQRREILAALAAVRRRWRSMGENFDASFTASVGPALIEVTDLAQARIAAGAQEYIPQVLVETRQGRAAQARFAVNHMSLVGTAGDGLTSEGLLYGAVTHAKVMVGAGANVTEALEAGSRFLTSAVGTLLSDTGRSSERLAMQARPVTGYVRMLNPPSCGRCVILAGKRSRSSEPFPRHPRCDCRNIPAAESVAGDLTVDPRAHLDSLTDTELARALGSKANAAAYRDGADINQLINAYRKTGGVTAAQVYGRNVKYTTEATTKRSVYGRAARAAGRDLQRIPRLMPESIGQIATDAQDRMRLLRLYGWIR